MNNYKFKIGDNTFDVSIESMEESMAEVIVNGTSYNVEMIGEPVAVKQKPVRVAKPQAAQTVVQTNQEVKVAKPSGSGKPVLSPLPGLILEMKVKEGDTVKSGDTLLIMEAMKMENNITSEYDGVVVAVKVSKGQTVMQNDVLVEIA